MDRTIEYFFTLSSPWAYLGHAALVDVAARHGAAIRYRPMPVGRVFEVTGGLPLPRRHPARQRYRLLELQRWRLRRGVPLNLRPRHVPLDATLADRTVVALVSAGLDPDPFVRRAFAAIWSEERDLADPGVLAKLLASGDVGEPQAVLAQAGGEEIAALHEGNYQAALAAGVFGAPSYLLGGELFWGQDQVEFLDEALASRRPAFRAD